MIIPSDWRAILARTQTLFPEAFICGGALSDLDNDRPVKDLDVFITSRGEKTKSMLDELFNIVTEYVKESAENPDSDTLDPLANIYEYSGNLFPLQFIVLPVGPNTAREFMIDQMNRFDIGLCRIGFDGKDVFKHPTYELDKKNKTLTMLHDRTLKQSRKRLERIGRKYPTFKQVEL